MARIDLFSPQERESIKKEIKEEIQHDESRRRLRNLVGWLLAAIVIVGLPLLYVTAQLAKSGFVDVPVFSNWLYKPTMPERVVLPLYGSKPEDVYKVIGTKIRFDPQTSLATLPMTEAELTTITQHAVTSAPPGSLPFPLKSMQVAIDADQIEIFAVSPQKNRDATVRVRFKPFVKDGEMKAEVHEVAIGGLILPKSVANLMFTIFGAFVTDSATKAIANIGHLMSVELDQGTVKFVLIPTVH